jgi:hypothetical protein
MGVALAAVTAPSLGTVAHLTYRYPRAWSPHTESSMVLAAMGVPAFLSAGAAAAAVSGRARWLGFGAAGAAALAGYSAGWFLGDRLDSRVSADT